MQSFHDSSSLVPADGLNVEPESIPYDVAGMELLFPFSFSQVFDGLLQFFLWRYQGLKIVWTFFTEINVIVGSAHYFIDILVFESSCRLHVLLCKLEGLASFSLFFDFSVPPLQGWRCADVAASFFSLFRSLHRAWIGWRSSLHGRHVLLVCVKLLSNR